MKLKLEFRLGELSLTKDELGWTELESRTVQPLPAPAAVAPQDLDVLSMAAAGFNGKEERSLSDSRTQLVGSAFNGVYAVDKAWLEYFAAVPQDKLNALCGAWCDEINELFMDVGIQPDEELCGFLHNLQAHCKQALAEEKLLVQLW